MLRKREPRAGLPLYGSTAIAHGKMVRAAIQDRDPIVPSAGLALLFLVLALHRIAIPTIPYFDETHYVPAARKLLELIRVNREHPMFAKEVLAGSITLLGDRPIAWRLPALLFGAFGLFAFGRLIWWISARRIASLAAIVLLATGFTWFVQSRIAMLDIFAASLSLVALWQFAAAASGRDTWNVRLRLAVSGICLALAMASKWSAVPLAIVPGLAFAALWIARKRSEALAKVSLIEAGFWLGLMPLALYWATFTPEFFYPVDDHRASPWGFVALHRDMIALQDSVTQTHTYQSRFTDWVLNLRPVWYLYEYIDGAQRGVLLLGNPLTMWLGLPALAWCIRTAIARRRIDAAVMIGLYTITLGLWVIAPKPIQFYYHYLMPSTFLLGGLALALDEVARAGRKGALAAGAVMAGSVGMFAWFYPILSGAELARGAPAFETWMWLDSWR